MKRILIPLLLTICATAQAGVYKRIDAEGNVEYTDIPQSQQETPVPLPPTTTYTPPPALIDGGAQPGTAPAPGTYDAVTITRPGEDETLRNDTGTVEVAVATTPPLQEGHHLVAIVDGSQKAESQTATLTVENLDRGTHRVQVQVVDDQGRVVADSPAVTFHLQRASLLLQQPDANLPHDVPEPYQAPPAYDAPQPLPEPYRQLPEPYRR